MDTHIHPTRLKLALKTRLNPSMPGYVLHTVPTHDKGSSIFYSHGGWAQGYEAVQKTRAQRAVQDMHHCKRSWRQCKPCDHIAMIAVACKYTYIVADFVADNNARLRCQSISSAVSFSKQGTWSTKAVGPLSGCVQTTSILETAIP